MRQRTLWFVVPAAGRLDLAAVCYRQLRRTCDTLTAHGTLATAVIVSDDENLELAYDCGFHTVERDNKQLGRKINDGYQLAGREGADWMVPLGNDDWIDPHWILLPRRDETVVTHLSTVVSEDRSRMAYLSIPYGDGVRVYTRATLERVGFRPAQEDRKRAIDTSTHKNAGAGARLVWRDTHPLAIVDWKTPENLNDYRGCAHQYGLAYRRQFRRPYETTDVWGALATVYDDEAIREMRALHDRGLVTA